MYSKDDRMLCKTLLAELDHMQRVVNKPQSLQ